MLLHTKRGDLVAKGEMICDLREMSDQTGPTHGRMRLVGSNVLRGDHGLRLVARSP